MKAKLKYHFLLVLTALSVPNMAHAQGTAFHYQGRLNDNGSPANGQYDLKFSIFDDPSAGSQVGDSVTNAPLSVSNGLFTVTLDFGAGVFAGDPRWLEIGVATNGSGGDFTTLSPRQALTPTPYAIYAASAANAAAVAPGSVASDQFSTPDPPADGQVLSYTGGSLLWTNPVAGDSVWGLNGNHAYYDNGNVGIGTTSPEAGYRLEVNGATRLTTGGSGGEIRFGTPAAETGMTIMGANRADVRFDGSTLKMVALTGNGVPPAENGIAIQTSGNVGIGTINPQTKLHVQDAGATEAMIRSTAERAILSLDSTLGGQNRVWTLENGLLGTAGLFGIYDRTAIQPRLVIAATGNVGVGSTTPGAKLHVDASGFGYGTAALLAVNTPGLAGDFIGRVRVRESLVVDLSASIGSSLNVSGTLTKGGGSFKIDHPLDPANKYLFHSFVESPDMMNIYNGNITLDERGEAIVLLPEWFSALNKDFRYQLTCIGGFAPVYVAEEITGNHFKIAGGRRDLKVSWQVTGVRQDAWANAHRIPVEQNKAGSERGSYLHPELFGHLTAQGAVKEQH